jgi:hypothetical protein
MAASDKVNIINKHVTIFAPPTSLRSPGHGIHSFSDRKKLSVKEGRLVVRPELRQVTFTYYITVPLGVMHTTPE